MNIIDISWPLTEEITEYKDRKTVSLRAIKTFESDGVRESQFCFHSHTGTHIDAPSHFLQHGKTIDSIDLSVLVGSCKVLDCTHIHEKITADDLKTFEINAGDKLLFKTRNSALQATEPFDYNFVYLDATGADYLVSKKVSLVGIDYLGIERNQPNHETHSTLLGNEVVIVEGLRLAHVNPGLYQLYCLPLAMNNVDAAPARAILIT